MSSQEQKKLVTRFLPPILSAWGAAAAAAGCPRVAPGGHLPESHQADLQGGTEVWVPLPGDGGRFGVSRQEGAHFPAGGQQGAPQAHPALLAASSTFRKALFSRAFMITGGIAGAEEKEMSSAGPHEGHPGVGWGPGTHPWPGLPCRCGTPPPGGWPSAPPPPTRPGGSRSRP